MCLSASGGLPKGRYGARLPVRGARPPPGLLSPVRRHAACCASYVSFMDVCLMPPPHPATGRPSWYQGRSQRVFLVYRPSGALLKLGARRESARRLKVEDWGGHGGRRSAMPERAL